MLNPLVLPRKRDSGGTHWRVHYWMYANKFFTYQVWFCKMLRHNNYPTKINAWYIHTSLLTCEMPTTYYADVLLVTNPLILWMCTKKNKQTRNQNTANTPHKRVLVWMPFLMRVYYKSNVACYHQPTAKIIIIIWRLKQMYMYQVCSMYMYVTHGCIFSLITTVSLSCK